MRNKSSAVMHKCRGFVSVGVIYAGIALLVGGLGITCYALYQRSEVAKARLADVEGQRDRALAAVKSGEEANAKLKAEKARLDQILVGKDERIRALEAEKRQTTKALNDAKNAAPKEDQDCLNRRLPDSISGLLRGS